MSVLGVLIGEVEDAINKVMQEAAEAVGVKDMIKQALDPIVGGAWKGKGADAFVNVVETQLLVAAQDAVESMSVLGGLITEALDIIKAADAILSAPAEIVESIFDAIF
jgi:hypothetical protein